MIGTREELLDRTVLPILMGWSVLAYTLPIGLLLSGTPVRGALHVWIGLCMTPTIAVALILPTLLMAAWLRTPSARRDGAPSVAHLEERSA